MIERATDDDHPFDVILVHSCSRFFRDSFSLKMFVRRLAKVGVRLISITQELGDDPAQVMMGQIISLLEEYQSRENGKHVLRVMKENARAGFYNGSPLPLGFTVAEVEKRCIRIKNRIVVDEVEAETMRLIFHLYSEGDSQNGPIGIKRLRRTTAIGLSPTLDCLRDVRTSRGKLEPELVERISRLMRDDVTSGPLPFRKSYLRAVVDKD